MKCAGALATLALALASTTIARADDRPSIGLTLNASIGTHEEASGRQSVPLLPIPLFDLRVPFKQFELEVEGVPSFGPVGYDSGIAAATRNTRISYAFGTLRYHVPNTRWSAGLGALVYNRVTLTSQTFPAACPGGCQGLQTVTVTEDDRSRVGGMRYEAAYTIPLSQRRSLGLQVGVAPSMHALIHEKISSFTQTFDAPESASQVDAQLRYAVRSPSAVWAYGFRYINYLAHFDSNGALSDRNTLFMPFAGVSFLLGR